MALGTIPASNPAGNNQTSPQSVVPMNTPQPIVAPKPQDNVFVPAAPGAVLGTNNPAPVPGFTAGAPVPSIDGSSGTTSALQTQETDIFGKGVGGSLSNLLSSIGGVDSATLEEFIKSLAPQEATAQANLNATLGAAGVNPNSSVAAIGEANLQSDIFSTIAGESAKLTQSGQGLEASILTGQQEAAAQEVASSGWDVFGQVINDVGNLAGDVVGTGGLGSILHGKK